MCSFSLKLSVLTNNSLVTCGDCFISAPLLLGSFAMNSTWSLSQLGRLDTISDLTAGNFGFQVILQTWVFCSFHSHQHQLRAWLLLYFWSNITTTIIMMKITPLYLCPKVLREKKNPTCCLIIFLPAQSANDQFLNKWPEKDLGEFMTRPSIDLPSAGKEEERPEELTTEGARQSCIIAKANKGGWGKQSLLSRQRVKDK